MKIDGINKAGMPAPEPKKTGEASGDAFAGFLKEAMGAGQTAKAAPVAGPAPVMPTAFNMTQAKNPFNAETVRQLEALLGDLELYQNTLANGEIPAKRLAPLGDMLMQKKDQLVALMGKIDDPKLKDLVSQAAAVVLNENSRLYAL